MAPGSITVHPSRPPLSRGPRVVFVAGSLGRGGAERQLDGWCGALVAQGWRTAVVTTDTTGPYGATLERRGATVVRVTRAGSAVSRIARVANAVRELDPQVVMSVQAHVNVHSVVAARSSRVRCIGALRTSPQRAVDGIGRFGPTALRWPDVLVANCATHLAEAVDRYGVRPSRAVLLRNWVDLDVVAPPSPLREPIIAFVGRLVAVKRPADSLRALVELQAGGTPWRLLVAGDGPLRPELERMARELGLTSDVEFLGHVHEIGSVLSRAFALVQTSESEGSSNALLEAMAHAVPVVATSVGDSTNLLSHGRGALVPVGQPAEIAARVTELWRNGDRAADVVHRARLHVEARHSLGSVGLRLNRILWAALVEGR